MAKWSSLRCVFLRQLYNLFRSPHLGQELRIHRPMQMGVSRRCQLYLVLQQATYLYLILRQTLCRENLLIPSHYFHQFLEYFHCFDESRTSVEGKATCQASSYEVGLYPSRTRPRLRSRDYPLWPSEVARLFPD